MVDLNTRDGSSTASLYDVMQYPAILALTDDGQLVKEWEGQSLPLMNEVAYYAHQQFGVEYLNCYNFIGKTLRFFYG